MRIALVSPYLERATFTGLSSYLEALVPRLLDAGHRVSVIGTDLAYRGAPQGELIAMDRRADWKVFPVRGRLNRRLYRVPDLGGYLQAQRREFDIVDIQGLWTFFGIDAAQACRAAGLPYVLTPHGMMNRWDWEKKRLEKRLFFELFERRAWRHAAAVRLLSQGEYDHAAVKPAGAWEIIPNAIELPGDLPARRRRGRARLGAAEGEKLVLFLGRVTAQKGVLELIAAFNAASRLAPGGLARARLLIAGPLAGEYGDRVRQAASSSPAGGRIELLGGVYGEQKAELQAAADLFVTLSKNEGLSLAALEALASGVPVLLTPASNLPAIAAAGVGEITAAAEAEAAAALLRLLSGEAALAAMQSRAAAFAAENFSWQSVLPRLLDFYARTARSAAG